MKFFFKLLFTFFTIIGFLFVGGILVTSVPTFVLFILKFVLGYSWNVVLIPTYLVMVVITFVMIASIFSPKLREKINKKRKS
jgi:ABC-type bacteriocin/lantibiotic exporter with double-glycine peptidase domain